MASTVVEPSQAERLGAVAAAGSGASDKNDTPGDPLSTRPANGVLSHDHSARASSSSDIEKKDIEAVLPSSDIRANGSLSGGENGGPPPVMEKSVGEEPPRSKMKVFLIMLSLMIAVFLAALDTTIITTAVPTITSRFHASEANYTWIGSAYLLAAAAATPTWGKISDIFGRKVVILVANLVFFVGSLIAALSINIRMLIAGRVIQGIGGGGLIILANICISDLFSMRERGKYFGMIGGVWGLASAVGPVLGGVFTQKVSWRWCFYINLPFDGLAFVIILFFLDIEIPKTPFVAGMKAIDWTGVLTITGGTVMFLLGLEYGGVSYPWSSPTVVCLIVFGLVTIGLFFINEWKFAKYPVMPLRLFKRRSNIASLAVCFVHGMVFISGAYFLPLYFQSVLGASPILSGVYLFPFVLSLSFISIVTGAFIKITGQYLPPIWFGMIFMAIGFGLYIDLPDGRSWGRIFAFQIIAGLGVGPNFQAPLIALQTLVEPRDIATATATFGFTRNLATSISVVIGGVIFQNRMMAQEQTLINALGPQVGSLFGGGSAGASTGLLAGLPNSQKAVAAAAYTASLRSIWIFYVAVAAVGVLASFAIGKQKLSKSHEKHVGGLAEEEKARKARKSIDAARKLDKEEKRRSHKAENEEKRRSRRSGEVTPMTNATANMQAEQKGDINV